MNFYFFFKKIIYYLLILYYIIILLFKLNTYKQIKNEIFIILFLYIKLKSYSKNFNFYNTFLNIF